MFERLSTFNEVLFVYGRLRMGKMGVLGAFSSAVLFTGLAMGLIVGWIWGLLTGSPIIPGHEILGGHFYFSILLVTPIIWFGSLVAKGMLFLSRKKAEDRQQNWSKQHWLLWNSEGLYSIATTNFMMSMFGVITLLCVCAARMRTVASIAL